MTTKSLNEWTKEELFALPHRAWDKTSEYDSVLLLSTGREHDSGWAMIAIIGVIEGQPVEIATSCSDDIEWILPNAISFGEFSLGQMRMDCALASGALNAWSRGYKFRVDAALSSIKIEVFKPIK